MRIFTVRIKLKVTVMKKLLLIIVCFSFVQLQYAQDLLSYEEGSSVKKHITYYKNGNKKAVHSIKNGKEHGVAFYFFENGKLMEQGNFNEGVKTGYWERKSESGVKLAEANYNDEGEKDGTWRIYDENGTLRYEMHYINEKKTGEWKVWNEQGELVDTKIF